jgi:hypothetical protein
MRSFRIAVALLGVAGLAGCGLLNGADESPAEEQGGGSWMQQAAAIEGIAIADPDTLETGHVTGPVNYSILPPVGGPHSQAWQNCVGDVYAEPIANEHAVHSLEHGAVWITYHPSLPADQVEALADRVSGNDKTFLSPFEALDAPISLQVWGYQLKVERADDSRIDEFIRVLRVNAAPEPNATCSGGVTTTGTAPIA